jgi:hypothetical protein
MKHIANGKPATDALAQAQREFLQQERKEKYRFGHIRIFGQCTY